MTAWHRAVARIVEAPFRPPSPRSPRVRQPAAPFAYSCTGSKRCGRTGLDCKGRADDRDAIHRERQRVLPALRHAVRAKVRAVVEVLDVHAHLMKDRPSQKWLRCLPGGARGWKRGVQRPRRSLGGMDACEYERDHATLAGGRRGAVAAEQKGRHLLWAGEHAEERVAALVQLVAESVHCETHNLKATPKRSSPARQLRLSAVSTLEYPPARQLRPSAVSTLVPSHPPALQLPPRQLLSSTRVIVGSGGSRFPTGPRLARVAVRLRLSASAAVSARMRANAREAHACAYVEDRGLSGHAHLESRTPRVTLGSVAIPLLDVHDERRPSCSM